MLTKLRSDLLRRSSNVNQQSGLVMDLGAPSASGEPLETLLCHFHNVSLDGQQSSDASFKIKCILEADL